MRLILAYKDATVEQHDQFLSARDLWIRAAQFFDPGFERSKNLVAKSGSVGVSRFEAGVARLLTLAGFRVAWFGKESAERRPDILAFHEFTSGQKTFLLVECTERNPMNKIDEAASRANELRGWLDDASCRVIPAVFSAAGRKEVDLQAAFEQRVALAGADELTKIWNAVEDGGASNRSYAS